MYNEFKYIKIPRTDVIHDKGVFLAQIMEQAKIFDSNKMNWKWAIADNPTDVVLFIKDLDIKRLMRCVKLALHSKSKELSKLFIHDRFTIRFIDGFHYSETSVRSPSDIEIGQFLIKEIKSRLLTHGAITTQQYRSEKGKLKDGDFKSTLKFLRNLSFTTSFLFSKMADDIIFDCTAYIKSDIHYKDPQIIYHIPNPIILGTIDVLIQCDE